MKKSALYFILILILLGGLTTYIIVRNRGKEVDTSDDTTQIEDEVVEDDEEEEQVVEEKEEREEGDLTGFSSSMQEVGDFVEDDKFTLESILDSSKDGYHEFVFNLKGPSEPKAIAKYDTSANVIKIEIFNIEKDSSGIPYQGERSINKEGVLKLYHNVSGTQEKSFYDIGLSQSTTFKLELISKSSEENAWSIVLSVKYPGEKEVRDNFGNSEFSKTNQSILGIGADKGASVNSYAYSVAGSVLKFTFDVSSTGDNPIPTASARFNDDGDIVLIFDSLKIDRVLKAVNGASLPLGISVATLREGEKSIYTFTGVGSTREFKLNANLSPNQVVIEIK